VKTGMSLGDEKSYLAEYGGIVESLGSGLIHPPCFGVAETRCVDLLRTGKVNGNSVC
jgi:hypothetical protein